MAKSSYDVIVVGAGFGGCTCAALLAKRGLHVLLLEKNNRAGGKAMSIAKDGFTHTAWVVIGAPILDNLHEKVLKELDMEGMVKLLAPAGQGAVYKNSSGEYKKFPQKSGGGLMEPDDIFNWLEVNEEEKEASLRVLTDISLMSSEQIDKLHDISLDDWLSQYAIPRSLYSFLIAPVSDGCFMVPPDAVAASEGVKTLQDIFLRSGGQFCEGGWGKLAETLAHAVEMNGGKCIKNARVEKITLEQGKVTGVVTSKGAFKAPVVVSNAGLLPTVLKLVGEEHFDRSYINYVKELIPSMGMMGTRYYLGKKVTDNPYGTIFSDHSPWSLELWQKALAGEIPEDLTVAYEVPSNYDPNAAPPGKQILMTGIWCPCDPQMTDKEKKDWIDRAEEILFKVFPQMQECIESKANYTTRQVSKLTRDQVLPGQGGECIGLGQIVGQTGIHKPSIKAPVRGLFFVGCDAGGSGVGIHQAADSGINVAKFVHRYHLMHRVTP